MADVDVIQTLQRLYAAESANPTQRLDQTMPWLKMREVATHLAIERIIAENREHQHMLAELLVHRGSAPPPACPPADAAGMHYQRLSALIPRMVQAEQETAAVYQAASSGLANDAEAGRVAGRIMARHQQHLTQLSQLEQPPKA